MHKNSALCESFELQEPFFAVIIRKIKGVRQLIKIKIFKSRFTGLKKASMVTLDAKAVKWGEIPIARGLDFAYCMLGGLEIQSSMQESSNTGPVRIDL